MQRLRQELRASNPTGLPAAVTVGTFDGVHLGHQALLGTLRDQSKRRGLRSVAICFRQQPRSVVQPGLPFSYLCELEERLALLRTLGLDCVCDVSFDDRVRPLTAEQFLGLLKSELNLKLLVMGPNAKQGHDQLGTVELQALGARMGFETLVTQPAHAGGSPVSSSAIRRALAEGSVEVAAALLGRPFSLTGTVLPGDRRGHELGFPTANLGPFAHATVPKDGIYATWAYLDGALGQHGNSTGARHMAATSIGVRPTFGRGNERRVEAYILDFSKDIYGAAMRLEFVKRLRDEVAYAGLQPLIEQIRKDVEATRTVLYALQRHPEAHRAEGPGVGAYSDHS